MREEQHEGVAQVGWFEQAAAPLPHHEPFLQRGKPLTALARQ